MSDRSLIARFRVQRMHGTLRNSILRQFNADSDASTLRPWDQAYPRDDVLYLGLMPPGNVLVQNEVSQDLLVRRVQELQQGVQGLGALDVNCYVWKFGYSQDPTGRCVQQGLLPVFIAPMEAFAARPNNVHDALQTERWARRQLTEPQLVHRSLGQIPQEHHESIVHLFSPHSQLAQAQLQQA